MPQDIPGYTTVKIPSGYAFIPDRDIPSSAPIPKPRGRSKSGSEPRSVTVTTKVTRDTAARIAQACGPLSRSEWLNQLILRELNSWHAGEDTLARIADGWRLCPDGTWRVPGDWPALIDPDNLSPAQARNIAAAQNYGQAKYRDSYSPSHPASHPASHWGNERWEWKAPSV